MRKVPVVVLVLLACRVSFVGQTASPNVQPFVKVNSPVVALTHVRVIDGTGAGTIAAGKQADLVVIKGDPSKKIEDIENAEVVFKDGVGYDSAKLIESVRGMVGSR